MSTGIAVAKEACSSAPARGEGIDAALAQLARSETRRVGPGALFVVAKGATTAAPPPPTYVTMEQIQPVAFRQTLQKTAAENSGSYVVITDTRHLHVVRVADEHEDADAGT